MPLTQIVANVASVVPATSEITYDKMWITNIRIMSQDPTVDAVLVATLKPCRDVNGEKELMPDAEGVTVRLDNVFAYAANNASFATAVNAVVDSVKDLGVEQGLFAN